MKSDSEGINVRPSARQCAGEGLMESDSEEINVRLSARQCAGEGLMESDSEGISFDAAPCLNGPAQCIYSKEGR